MEQVFGCLTHDHDLRLVLAAALICVMACATTVRIMAIVRGRDRRSWLWLVCAAVVFGGGVWSLHFVAMLAFMPGLPISYAWLPTLCSILIACTGSFPAFVVWHSTPTRGWRTLLAGLLLGSTVSGMHYCGETAMRVPGRITLDDGTVLASILVGLVLSGVAFWRAGELGSRRRRLEIGCWLALAITGMHFTAMSGLHIQLGVPGMRETGIDWSSLAVGVTSTSLMLLAISFAITVMDQHLSRRAVEELRRLRLMGDISREAILIQRRGIVLQANLASGRLFGVSPEQLVGRRFSEMVAESCRSCVLYCENDIVGQTGPLESPGEICVVAGQDREVPVEFSSSTIDYEGGPATVVTLRDQTDRKRDEARIRYLALHDALTDLPNRFLLNEKLGEIVDMAPRTGENVAVICLDLDRFKLVNDLLGHQTGDQLLIQVGRRLRDELRPSDVLGRTAADEFVIVVSLDEPRKAATLASRLIDKVGVPYQINGQAVEISASLGIACHPQDGNKPEQLLHAADLALRRAKEAGPGSFRFFEPQMNEQLFARRQLEHDLRHAIERNELMLYYQPLTNCASGEIEGYEALLRWSHPTRGLVSPAEFIPLAEETGLIRRIGEWVLRSACATAAAWPNARYVAVNVSPVQFRQGDLPLVVAAALDESGLPPGRLEVEITENILIEDAPRALEVLSQLRDMGVHLALDDFGTGYSSLSYLRSFRFHKLKIDQSFIREIGQSEDATTIVRTIIGLAHNLGLQVTAEGVETNAQFMTIQKHLCDAVQGYLFGRPAPMDEQQDVPPRQQVAARLAS